MKRIALILFSVLFLTILFGQRNFIFAQDPSSIQQGAGVASEGAWIIDPEVTRIGKNASRSGQLLDWTLKDYQWASSSAQQISGSPLAAFWVVIQRIVYALFLVVILITAFVLIVTRGKSLSAKRFLPRFFLAVLLVTFSFSLIQFIYQITDILQGFFLKNPQGQIISSKDLLYIGFNYTDFQGLRRVGLPFEESAFISLILVKFTAFTYYVMALLLIFRKILLWFFIVLSPLFPILLLFYPVRNTGKIWIGEFFRWVMYAPLFAVLLSGLVKLWQTGLPLIFNFSGVSKGDVVYPTAVNILLGGPGQHIGVQNSVNLPDTFALYVVALIMLWAVIILPFILLQIFLDHMMAFNYQDSPIAKQMLGLINNRLVPPPKPLGPPTPVGPTMPAGLARNLPYGRRFEVPSVTGLSKQLPISTSQRQVVQQPVVTRIDNKNVVANLTNLSIPTMRDIARFETTKLSRDTKAIQEISRVQQTLRQIANPVSTSSKTERDRMQLIRERLRIEGQKGNPVASHILNAATTYNTYSSQSSAISTTSSSNQLIQNLATPERLTEKTEREKLIQIKEQLTQAASNGNNLAQTVLTTVNTYTSNQLSQLTQILQNLAHPEKVTSTTERQTYSSLREKLVTASKSGNQLATMVMNSLEKATSKEEVRKIQDQLLQAQSSGSPIAAELLKTIESKTQISDKDIEQIQTKIQEASSKGEPLATALLQLLRKQKAKIQAAPAPATAKLKAGTFPVVNRIQQVSLDDYEAVRKMWKENYQNLEVPESVAGQQTRKDWITQDISDIEQTISLLSSSNPEEVQQGMQKVSDILPFLLIGGFSQTEIIAYLKAKMEAGKSVLEEVSKRDEEEETFQMAERKARAVASQTMTAEIVDTSEEERVAPPLTNIKNIVNNTTMNTSQVQAPAITTPVKNITTNNSLLQLVQLPFVTMKDIVRFETARQAVSQTDRLERERIQQTLTKIANPESLSNSTEKEKFARIREELMKEQKNGNPLASLILDATNQTTSSLLSLTKEQQLPFIAHVQALITPSLASDAFRDDYLALNKTLLVAREKADNTAFSLLRLADQVTLFQEERTQEFLEKISNPSGLATASEQMHYSKLLERIAQESEDGNQTAATILKLARKKATLETAQMLFQVITQAAENGDTLAAYLASSLYSFPQELQQAVTTTYETLVKGKAQGNDLASAFLRLFSKQLQKKTGVPPGIVTQLPRENRIQRITLEDYETVRKLWTENYKSVEPPQTSENKKMSRAEWINQEIQSISDAINLLSSGNPEDVQEGMKKVGDILPFLLLGGFSKDETIGYLKAKMEAGKAVLQEVNKELQEDETLVENHKTVVTPKQAQMTAEVEGGSTATKTAQPATTLVSQSDALESSAPSSVVSQFKLPLPSLKDIATFEQKRNEASIPTILELKNLLSNLSNPERITSQKERDQVRVLKQTLKRQAEKGDITASSILNSTRAAETAFPDSPQAVIMTFARVLDPSLVMDSEERKEYIQAREELVRAREDSNENALKLVKLVDTASHELTYETVKLLQLLIPDGQKNEPDRAHELRKMLESAKDSRVAQTLLASSSSTITPVSANKVRVQLIEAAAAGDPLAREVITNYLPLPKEVITQITNYYQQLTASKERDPLAERLLRLLTQQKQINPTRLGMLQLPKQNRMQKVSLDDYETVRQMLYEMYLHADIPLTADGKTQTREQWITADKEQVTKAINLIASDIPDNVAEGLEMVGDILPFLLIGGFTKDEITHYLKAKETAAEMALQTLQGAVEANDELVPVPKQRSDNEKKLEEQAPFDEKGEEK